MKAGRPFYQKKKVHASATFEMSLAFLVGALSFKVGQNVLGVASRPSIG
jgi:hypothetical protein